MLVTLWVRWGAHVIESSAGQQRERERKYSCERELRLHCLGKAGSLGGDCRPGCCYRRDAVVKDLGLVTCFFVVIDS